MKMKMVSTLMVIVAIMMSLAGCSGKEEVSVQSANAPAATTVTIVADTPVVDIKPAVPVKIALVLNNLGDKGFNDEAFAGMQMAKEKLGIEFDYVEAPQISEVETQIRMFADSGEYALIVVIGADKKDAIESAAMDYPDQKFSLVDSKVDEMPNLHGVGSRDPEQTFLSGVIAGLVTLDPTMPLANPENVIGFMGGMDSPASRAGAAGFLSGVKFVNPDAQIIYTIVGSYANPNKGKEIATTMYERGADVVSHNAGGSALGLFNAGRELNKYFIGSSLATADPKFTLCTSIKRTDLFVFQEVESLMNGTWTSGYTAKGIKEGVCYYDLQGLDTNLNPAIIAIADEIKQMVIDGKIEMCYDPAVLDAWSAKFQYARK
jgi:basic membrane protein A